MANYNTLKTDISSVIRQNDNNEITGQILQQSLLSMVNSLGAGYQYMGVATPTTNPGTLDARVFYIASQAGTYSNFNTNSNPIIVNDGEVAILKYDSVWHKEITGIDNNDKDLSNIFASYGIQSKSLFDIGNIGISADTEWVYAAYNKRIRTREGCTIHLYPGDKITLSDYSNTRMWIGWKVGNTYKSVRSWQTMDYTITEEGEYVFIVSGVPESVLQSVDELYSRVKIISHAKDIIPNTIQFNEMKPLFVQTESDIYGIKSILNWDNGNLARGVFGSLKYRIATPSTLYADKDIIINAKTGYRFGVHILTSDGTFVSDTGWKTTYTISKGTYFRIVIAKTTEILSETADIVVFLSNIETPNIGIINDVESLKIKTQPFIRSIRSVAHQGYPTIGNFGFSMPEGYIKAAEMGFDWGECDITFSSDNVAFCCHPEQREGTFQNGFTDAVSGEWVSFDDSTAEQILTHNYIIEGNRVPTFDAVLAACKSVGLGLYIDKTSNINTDARRVVVFSLIAKYVMYDKIVWCIPFGSASVPYLANYAKSKFQIQRGLTASDIASANSIKTDLNEVSLAVNYTSSSINDIITACSSLKAGVTIEVYTIDNIATYKEYMPYVSAITSNRLSERDAR